MRVRIHRGTREIGGTCIEVEAQGKRIALDVGLPLDVPKSAFDLVGNQGSSALSNVGAIQSSVYCRIR